MKKLLIATLILAFILTSCTTNPNNQSSSSTQTNSTSSSSTLSEINATELENEVFSALLVLIEGFDDPTEIKVLSIGDLDETQGDIALKLSGNNALGGKSSKCYSIAYKEIFYKGDCVYKIGDVIYSGDKIYATTDKLSIATINKLLSEHWTELGI